MSQMEGLTLALIIGGAIDAVLLVISVILAILLIVAKQREKMAKIRWELVRGKEYTIHIVLGKEGTSYK